MNERIKQLAEQAGIEIEFDDYGEVRLSTAYGSALGQFAKLIVRECIRVPYDMWDKAELNADLAVKIEHRIKEHLGV
jgi:hypothetical protein